MANAQTLTPSLSRWITMLVVSTVAAGFGLLRFAVGLLEGFVPENIFDFWASYTFMGMVPVAAAVLFSRRWFVTQSDRVQSIMFWSCLLVPASGFVAFVLLLYTAGRA